jgi:hypothetical protein
MAAMHSSDDQMHVFCASTAASATAASATSVSATSVPATSISSYTSTSPAVQTSAAAAIAPGIETLRRPAHDLAKESPPRQTIHGSGDDCRRRWRSGHLWNRRLSGAGGSAGPPRAVAWLRSRARGLHVADSTAAAWTASCRVDWRLDEGRIRDGPVRKAHPLARQLNRGCRRHRSARGGCRRHRHRGRAARRELGKVDDAGRNHCSLSLSTLQIVQRDTDSEDAPVTETGAKPVNHRGLAAISARTCGRAAPMPWFTIGAGDRGRNARGAARG